MMLSDLFKGVRLLSLLCYHARLTLLRFQCVQAATSLVKLMVDDLAITGFVPYLPELTYAQSAFAVVILLKVYPFFPGAWSTGLM